MAVRDMFAKEVLDFVDNIKVGDRFHASIPFASNEPMKIHIRHIMPSIYQDRKLIIYMVYGKHKQWWHEFMCSDWDMMLYITNAKDLSLNKPQ